MIQKLKMLSTSEILRYTPFVFLFYVFNILNWGSHYKDVQGIADDLLFKSMTCKFLNIVAFILVSGQGHI